MAETPEGKVKRWIREQMKAWFPNAWHYPCPGGPFGKIGAPDDTWVIGVQGVGCVFVAIEVKADGNEPTAKQYHELTIIAKNGGIATFISGRDVNKLHRVKAEIERRINLLKEMTNVA